VALRGGMVGQQASVDGRKGRRTRLDQAPARSAADLPSERGGRHGVVVGARAGRALLRLGVVGAPSTEPAPVAAGHAAGSHHRRPDARGRVLTERARGLRRQTARV
jgi:hypothetical protein